MISLSLMIVASISMILIVEWIILNWIHQTFALKSLHFQLINGTLLSKKKSKKSCAYLNWFHYLNIIYASMLLFISVIIGWMIIEKISQPLTKALYIESIVINVIIVTLSIIQLLRITLANCKILFQSQMEEEERLLIQCGQRAQLYSDSFSEASSSVSNKQTDQSSSFTSSSNTSNLSNQSTNTATTNKLCDSSFDMPI